VSGKGDRRRPQYVSDETFGVNWGRAFAVYRWLYDPGAAGAVERGCLCPVADNAERPSGYGFVVRCDCPMHGVDPI